MDKYRAVLPDAADRPSAEPFRHYLEIFAQQDPADVAQRTGLIFDDTGRTFSLSLLGNPLKIIHPDFSDALGVSQISPYEKLLIIRYLTSGRYTVPSGRLLSYEELPWGNVYMSNFRGRVIQRLVREFGQIPESFENIVETMPGLNFERIDIGDASYRIEFINGQYITLIYYEGDEEFPSSFQLLFDDNVKNAFSAEDVAVIGDILIARLKSHYKKMIEAKVVLK